MWACDGQSADNEHKKNMSVAAYHVIQWQWWVGIRYTMN